MASLVISAPSSPLALFGWMNLQSVCNLFSSVAMQARSTMTSLTLLLKLREKASDALSGRQAPFFKAPSPAPNGDGSDDEGDSSNLIGLHTRLIERGNQGMAKSRVFKGNVRSPSPRQQTGQPPQSRSARSQSTGGEQMTGTAPDMVRPAVQRVSGGQAADVQGPPLQTLADFIGSNPFSPQQQQHQAQQAAPSPGQAQDFLLSYSQMQAPNVSTGMDAVDEPDSHTTGILVRALALFVSPGAVVDRLSLPRPLPQNALWAPQGDDWSTANQQVDWENLSATLGINFQPAAAQNAWPPNPDDSQQFSHP